MANYEKHTLDPYTSPTPLSFYGYPVPLAQGGLRKLTHAHQPHSWFGNTHSTEQHFSKSEGAFLYGRNVGDDTAQSCIG